jgi:hypothetical protein
MTHPNDIPKDVWDRAGEIVAGWYGFMGASSMLDMPAANTLIERIARAILAERERAARVIDAKIIAHREECKNRVGGGPAYREAMFVELATAIRSGK